MGYRNAYKPATPGHPCLEDALAPARRGWFVFPVIKNDKMPGLQWGELATDDLDVIEQYWIPGDNVGIATGPSGLLVVDLDPRTDNKVIGWMLDFLERDDETFGTYTVETASLGRHLYYQQPSTPLGNSAGKIHDGVDTRGVGGFVVAAGSYVVSYQKNYSGPYSVIDDSPVAPLPDVLRNVLEYTGPVESAAVRTRRYRHMGTREFTRRRDQLLQDIRDADAGTLNTTLFARSCRAAELVAAGLWDQGEAMDMLEAAARENWDYPGIVPTILSAFRQYA